MVWLPDCRYNKNCQTLLHDSVIRQETTDAVRWSEYHFEAHWDLQVYSVQSYVSGIALVMLEIRNLWISLFSWYLFQLSTAGCSFWHDLKSSLWYLLHFTPLHPSVPRVLVDVEVLSGALEMSRVVLLRDPCQLASQLMGRLGQMVIEDRPVAKGIRWQNLPLTCVVIYLILYNVWYMTYACVSGETRGIHGVV